jgi:hypothetical protein
MQVVASLTVDLDNWVTVADNIVGRYLSWLLYFRVVSVGGGHGVAACRMLLINVPYKHTFGAPDQGQTLDV